VDPDGEALKRPARLRSLTFNSTPWPVIVLVVFLLSFGLFITFGPIFLAANPMLMQREDPNH
jgi:hypothetical protein